MTPADMRNALSADHFEAVTPSDSTTFAQARYFSLIAAGDITVDTAGGELNKTITSGMLAAGVVHPLRVTRIYDTGTTATSVATYW